MNSFMQKTGLRTAARWFDRLGAGLRILVLGAVVLLAMMPALVLHAQTTSPNPSTDPLLNRDGGGVKPNVMLIVDDSGSMLFQTMPDSAVYLGNSPSASISPLRTVDLGSGMRGSHSLKMHPTDTMILASVYAGVVAGSTTSSNWRQAFLRSPDTNTIYYNPEVRYLPWVRPDTTRMPNSTATSAPIDPMNFSGTRVNLQTVSFVNERWCAPPGSGADCSTANGTTATVNLRFNPMLYYRVQKNADGSYKSPTSTIANFDRYDLNPVTAAYATTTYVGGTLTRYPARTDCAANPCTLAEERVNFANWFTYYRSRALLAKGGLSESFVSGSNTFRIGYGVINDTSSNNIDGVSTNVIQQGVRDFTVAQRSTTIAWLQGLPISGGTPLRTSLDLVGQYYMRSDNGGPWSDDPAALSSAPHKSCRRSYMFMVTDGYWNDTVSGAGNADNTAGSAMSGPSYSYPGYSPGPPYSDDSLDTLADYAMKYWKTDLRGGTGTTALTNNVVPTADNPAFWQHMSGYFIGLGVRGTLNPDTDLPYLTSGTKTWTTDRIDDLWHAAVNSRGAYFSAKDSTELASAIRSSLSSTVERELREAGVATATTILENGNRKYVPFYRTSAWNGDVQAYSLDANGVAGAVQWTAESKLPPWASRNIVTWDRGVSPAHAVTFTWATISADSKSALGTITATYTATFVDFLRGDRSQEGSTLAFRPRDGVLGDFINSNPVVVLSGFNGGYSGLSVGGPSYTSFLNSKTSRTFGVLFIGGNDGMLHGFKDTKTTPAVDGQEVFAYVPRAIYPSLATLATITYGTSSNYHRFYVDGPLAETDAFIPVSGASGTATWRNLLLGSVGAGGRAVFALDVTDTANLGTSTVKWEISDADDTDLGYVMSPIESGVLPNGEWVAIFGNGYYSTSGLAKLFVVTLKDGVIRKLTVNSTDSNNGLGGVAVVRDSTGYIQSLYAGDQAGKMWRMDYSAAAPSFFSVGLSGNRLIDAKTSVTAVVQPITQRPVIYPHPNGGNFVVFGTGQLLTTTDADSTLTHSLYGVWDKTSPTTTESLTLPLGRTYLKTRTITTVNGSGGAIFYSISGATITWTSGNDRGWVIDLNVTSGLRLVYPPQKVSSNEVLMSTVAPAANVAQCDSGTGRGINFVFDVFTGANPTYPFFDTNGDGLFTSADVNVSGYSTGADGVDAIVKGATSCDASGLCTTKVSFQNTTGQMGGQSQYQQSPGGGSPRVLTDRLWRRIINPPIP